MFDVNLVFLLPEKTNIHNIETARYEEKKCGSAWKERKRKKTPRLDAIGIKYLPGENIIIFRIVFGT